MNAQPDDHRAVERAGGDTDRDADGERQQHRARAPVRRRPPQDESHQDARQRVDRPDRQVDAARDDHDRRADRHDRDEAGVGCGLDQRVRVEEVVDRVAGVVDVRPGQQRQRDQKQDDDTDEAKLLRPEQPAHDGRQAVRPRRVGGGFGGRGHARGRRHSAARILCRACPSPSTPYSTTSPALR